MEEIFHVLTKSIKIVITIYIEQFIIKANAKQDFFQFEQEKILYLKILRIKENRLYL